MWDRMRGALKRALFKWNPKDYGSVDQAEASLDKIFRDVIVTYVKVKMIREKLPAPWWNYTCAKKLRYKCKMFHLLEAGKVDQAQYLCAARVCRKAQKKPMLGQLGSNNN